MNAFVKKLSETKGKKRSTGIIAVIANDLKVEQDALGAFIEVEAAGSGFDTKQRLKILFEKHHFYKHVPAKLRDRAVKEGLARKDWISPKKGGYNDQKTTDDKWRLLDRAANLDETAALKSASLGAGQVLGAHAEWLGYLSPQQMWERNAASEDAQIETMGFYIRRAGLIDEMQRKDWRALAKGYNGPGQVDVYAPRLEAAYKRLKKVPDEPMPSSTLKPLPTEEDTDEPLGPQGVIAWVTETYHKLVGDDEPAVPPLRCGDEGDDVKAVQQALNRYGFKLAVDGDFGKGTERAVMDFQKSKGQEPTGVVVAETRKALGMEA